MQTHHEAAANANGTEPVSVHAAVSDYLARGWQPIPVPPRSKNPGADGWQKIRVTPDTIAEHFTAESNVGLLLGAGLVDVDLDVPEAVRAAPHFLPKTELRHGRPGSRESHYWYTSAPDLRCRKFQDPTGEQGKKVTLLELRSNTRSGRGAQTVVPPSIHEDTGELIEWEANGEPAQVSEETLLRAAKHLAATVLLARYYPAEGARHDFRLALAGWLLRGGVAVDDAERIASIAAYVVGADTHDAAVAVRDTAKLIESGGAATGGGRLLELLGIHGPAILDRLTVWLDLRKEPPDQAEAEPEPERRELVVLNVAELLGLEVPPRATLLWPWVPAQGLCMIHAFRGIGKSHLALGAAYAIAAGGDFLRFRAPEPQRVLFVDGELPVGTIQSRLAATVKGSIVTVTDPGLLRIITPDVQELGMPDLATKEGQQVLEPYLEGVSVVWLDNISTLFRSGIENEAESWLPVQSWALELRRRGIAVVFVHHSGKTGAQRGTSRREDVLDTVISLRRPTDYTPEQGARFELHFEKHRGFFGDDAKPFEAQLEVDGSGRATWTVKDLEDRTTERVAELIREGNSQRDVAAELHMTKSTVNRHVKKARERGLLHQ